MRVHITQLEYWKSEHDASTNEDSLRFDVGKGLFAVADGVGSASFAKIWSGILVDRFVEEPLMSEHPFEVEWWARRAQEEYTQNKQTRPESVPDFAKEKAREGSRSTLATIRFTEADGASAKAMLLAVGDSDLIIARNGTKEIEAFPLDKASEFDARPIILPTRLIEFDRAFHRCQTKQVELHVGDTIILATDAVSKWILSRPIHREAFEQVASIRPGEEWADFIERRRKEDAIIDDDSTALVIKLTDRPDDPDLGVTNTYSTQVIEERKAALDKYKDDPEMLAICFGDGKWQARDGMPEDDAIQNARLIADAIKEVRLALSSTVKTGKLSTAWKTWDTHRSLLMGKPWAATLIKSLAVLGIPLEGSMPPEELPGPVKPSEVSMQRETVKGGKPMPSSSGTRALSELPSRLAAGMAEGRREPSNVAAANTPGLPLDKKTLHQRNQFRLALGSDPRKIASMQDAERIANSYNESLDQHIETFESNLGREARRIVEMTKRVRDAIMSNDDQLILKAYDRPELNQDWLFEPVEWIRIYLARLRKSLEEGNDDQSAQVARDLQTKFGYSQDKLTEEERSRLSDARDRIRRFLQFEIALGRRDDEEIRMAYDNAFERNKKYTEGYRQEYERARQRLDALDEFRQALATKQDEKIVQAYSSILDGYSKIAQSEREQLERATKRMKALADVRKALRDKNELEIVKSVDASLLGSDSSEIHEKSEEIAAAFFTFGWLLRILDWTVQKNTDAMRTIIRERTLIDAEGMERQVERLERMLQILTDERKDLLAQVLPIVRAEIAKAKKERQKKGPLGLW